MADGEHVGFVGLGNMGWPMAHNLAAAGYQLSVRDADPDRQQRFADEHHATAATTPTDFAPCRFIVTMLPDDTTVADAIRHWDGGIAAALAPGAIVIDMSSSNPRGTKTLGDALQPLGIGLVDAPVSGGVPRATTGTLSLMIGGTDTDVNHAWPLLQILGDPLFRTGPLGSGHAMKCLNNFIAGSAYTATAEALAVGLHFGLDPETMIEVINTSSGRSMVSELVFRDHIVPGRYATGFALGLMAKDVGIAADLVEATGVEAPVCELVARRYAEALSGLGAASDHSRAHLQWWPADFTARGR